MNGTPARARTGGGVPGPAPQRRQTGWAVGVVGLLALAGCLADVPPVTRDDLPAGGTPGGSGPAPQFGMPLGADALVLRSPVRVARTGSGWLLVTDARQQAVFRVDPASLQPDQALAIEGTPLAIGMAGDRIFVGNTTRRTVEVFNHLGQPAGALGGVGGVGYPSDLAVDADAGLVFVVDGLARDVKVFETGGTLRRVIGTAATFETPIGVAVDPARREVLISDYGNPGASIPAAVKIFSYDGDFLGAIHGRGTCGAAGCRGAFSRPQGVAVDAAGRVYVVDALQAGVLVFDRAGLSFSAEISGAARRVRLPSDVVLDADGSLLVVSNLGIGVERLSGLGAAR